MRYALLLVMLFGQLSLRAQDADKYSRVVRKAAKGDTSCKGYYTELAKDDIVRGNAVLITKSGCWVEAVPSQYEFERRYGVRYELPGCIQPDREECLVSYNKVVFSHLDSLYHGKWRKTVRTDVLGFHRRYLIFR